MGESSEVWAWWMLLLAVLAVLIIFVGAWIGVTAIRDGNRSVRLRQLFGRWRRRGPQDPRDIPAAGDRRGADDHTPDARPRT